MITRSNKDNAGIASYQRLRTGRRDNHGSPNTQTHRLHSLAAWCKRLMVSLIQGYPAQPSCNGRTTRYVSYLAKADRRTIISEGFAHLRYIRSRINRIEQTYLDIGSSE